jgi:MFS transporter, LPLT family, lysophospholipid transporter
MSSVTPPAPETMRATLWTRAMTAVLATQFLSALGDNALLFAALALLKSKSYPDWAQPLLQEFFVAAAIVLAPFAGPIADSWPKGRVLLLSNGLKLLGALGTLAGLDTFVCYAIVGVGAALYSPAKYGILSELTTPDRLVQANGLMESSTIAAILSGAVLGGGLADWNVRGALAVVAGVYAIAAIANLFIPVIPAAHALARTTPVEMLKDFGRAFRRLNATVDARFAVAGTSLFWGAGSTMRFLLIAWTPIALGIANNREPAYLNGVVAVGIVAGAAIAGRLVTLQNVNRALSGGIVLGLAVCLLSVVTSLHLAYVVLLVIGAGGGFFVVPLNALLQTKGHESVGAGRAVAVQNGVENLVMLLMLGIYTALDRVGVPTLSMVAGFGGFLALAITALWTYRLRKQRQRAPPCPVG